MHNFLNNTETYPDKKLVYRKCILENITNLNFGPIKSSFNTF